MAHEVNRNGNYYCVYLSAACDFQILGLESVGVAALKEHRLVEWILEKQLPFDSLYFYGSDSRSETLRERPIHISYGLQHRQNVWAFTTTGMPKLRLSPLLFTFI